MPGAADCRSNRSPNSSTHKLPCEQLRPLREECPAFGLICDGHPFELAWDGKSTKSPQQTVHTQMAAGKPFNLPHQQGATLHFSHPQGARLLHCGDHAAHLQLLLVTFRKGSSAVRRVPLAVAQRTVPKMAPW